MQSISDYEVSPIKTSGCLFLPLVLRIFCQSLGFFSPWPRLKRHPVHDTTWRPLNVEKFQFKPLCFISKPKHQNPTSPPTLMLRPPSRVRNFRISRKRRSWQTWPWGASPRQVNYKCICLYSKNINIYYIYKIHVCVFVSIWYQLVYFISLS